MFVLADALRPSQQLCSQAGIFLCYTKYNSPNLEGSVDFSTPVLTNLKVEKHFDVAIHVYGYAVSKKIKKINIFPYHISEQAKE